jgi:hypothetical protein
VIKRAGLAAIATIALTAGAAGAEAGVRLGFNYFPFGPGYGGYYGEPYMVPPPRYYYYQPRPRYRPHYYAYQYEPDYYEPEVEPNYRAPPRSKLDALPSQKPLAVPSQKKSGAISCDQATKIVSDYGFRQVKATSCSGKIFAFNAQRDGRPFSVKVSSASGELTEVKKQ